jgi:hypothetical protein
VRTKRHCLEKVGSISKQTQLFVEYFQVLGLLRSWKSAFQDSSVNYKKSTLKFLAGAGFLCDKILPVYTWNLLRFVVLGHAFIFKCTCCSIMPAQTFKLPSPFLLHVLGASIEGQGDKELGAKTDTGFVQHFLHALLPYRVTQSQ